MVVAAANHVGALHVVKMFRSMLVVCRTMGGVVVVVVIATAHPPLIKTGHCASIGPAWLRPDPRSWAPPASPSTPAAWPRKRHVPLSNRHGQQWGRIIRILYGALHIANGHNLPAWISCDNCARPVQVPGIFCGSPADINGHIIAAGI
ncbi:hypothetical protein QYE76_047168 [Lolium multiflorum]|uniref:Uncharacterized protein n=1 Tax=Lolium multiflorum TaxID=4521 RepID=A0AAD8TPB0_LOLMU|nr:hypothetical protein QYE76_047168 [Lolium multiflorum]